MGLDNGYKNRFSKRDTIKILCKYYELIFDGVFI